MAKWFDVKVEEFGVGLPPKAMTMWKKGDTSYTLNWLPLGGFVRLYGDSDVERVTADDPRSFLGKPVYQRFLIAAAGIVSNFIVAYLLFVMLFTVGFMPLGIVPDASYPLQTSSYSITTEAFAAQHGILTANPDFVAPTIIHDVMEDSHGMSIGIKPGSYILRFNGEKVASPQEFITQYKATSIGEDIALTTMYKGSESLIRFTKKDDILGVSLAEESPYQSTGKNYQVPFPEALVKAGEEVGNLTILTFDGLANLGKSLVTSFALPKDIGGPIQIAQTVHVVTEQNTMAMGQGLAPLLILAAIISVNLAVLNLLPIPALDGGRMLFLALEGITRRPLPRKFEVLLHMAGYMFLIFLMIAITVKDVMGLM